MIKLVNKLKDYFDPPQNGTVTYDYYVRTGECNSCGKCCSGIYLIHGEEVIDTIAKFDKLKLRHDDYKHFTPMEETAQGVMFRCSHLQPDNRCGIYDDRPMFCRKYPTEDTLLMGGVLAPGCGFTFKTKIAFQDVLQKTSKKKKLNPGTLLNDVGPDNVPTEHQQQAG